MATPRPLPPTVVLPTAAEIRRADKAATRPDGTIDPSLFALAIARPLHLDERDALAATEKVRESKRNAKAPKSPAQPPVRVKKAG